AGTQGFRGSVGQSAGSPAMRIRGRRQAIARRRVVVIARTQRRPRRKWLLPFLFFAALAVGLLLRPQPAAPQLPAVAALPVAAAHVAHSPPPPRPIPHPQARVPRELLLAAVRARAASLGCA